LSLKKRFKILTKYIRKLCKQFSWAIIYLKRNQTIFLYNIDNVNAAYLVQNQIYKFKLNPPPILKQQLFWKYLGETEMSVSLTALLYYDSILSDDMDMNNWSPYVTFHRHGPASFFFY